MENIPQINSFPTATGNTPSIGGPSSLVNDLLGTQSVTITVARNERSIANHLIVTFAKKGPLTYRDLLACNTSSQMLARAEFEGVDINEPALLASVGDDGIARTIYLTPVPQTSFRDFAVWVGQVTETIANLKSEQVGIYLCKDSLKTEDLAELVNQAVRSLVESKNVKDICLVVGQHAYNEVLSTALQLKQELDGPGASVHVLH